MPRRKTDSQSSYANGSLDWLIAAPSPPSGHPDCTPLSCSLTRMKSVTPCTRYPRFLTSFPLKSVSLSQPKQQLYFLLCRPFPLTFHLLIPPLIRVTVTNSKILPQSSYLMHPNPHIHKSLLSPQAISFIPRQSLSFSCLIWFLFQFNL